LTDIQASMLLVNPTSAWLMLEDELRVQPGEWIVQNAGNSIVARFVAQIAKLRGYRVVSVVRRADVTEELIEAGAEHVISEAGAGSSRRIPSFVVGGRMLLVAALS